MKFVIYPSLLLPYCSTIYSFAFPLCYLLRKTPCICSRAPHFKYDCTLKCEIALNINIEPTCVSDLILLHVSQTIHKLTGQAHPTPSTSWGFSWRVTSSVLLFGIAIYVFYYLVLPSMASNRGS